MTQKYPSHLKCNDRDVNSTQDCEIEVKRASNPSAFQRGPYTVLANNPIPMDCPKYYFEVEIQKSRLTGIGIQKAKRGIARMPGWDSYSYGYYGIDGKKYQDGIGQPYGPKYTSGDVIGVLYNQIQKTIIFYINGQQIGTAFKNVPTQELYPCVGISASAKVRVNFGQYPFVAQLEDLKQPTAEKFKQYQLEQQFKKENPQFLKRMTFRLGDRDADNTNAVGQYDDFNNDCQDAASSYRSIPTQQELTRVPSVSNSDGVPARKLALIIGNIDYQHPDDLPVLQNCVRDAELVDQTLSEYFGFKTTLLKNCTNDQILLAVKNFSQKIQTGDIIVFYFSGHAGQQNKNNKQENHLFGVDSCYECENGQETMRGVRLNKDIIKEFDEESIYLVIVDACRVFPAENKNFKSQGKSSGFDYPELPKNLQDCVLGAYQLPDNIGRAQFDVVFACEPGKFAVEDTDQQHGYLASSMCKSLLKNEFWNDVLIDIKNDIYELTNSRQCPSVLSQLRIKLNLKKVIAQRQNTSN